MASDVASQPNQASHGRSQARKAAQFLEPGLAGQRRAEIRGALRDACNGVESFHDGAGVLWRVEWLTRRMQLELCLRQVPEQEQVDPGIRAHGQRR